MKTLSIDLESYQTTSVKLTTADRFVFSSVTVRTVTFPLRYDLLARQLIEEFRGRGAVQKLILQAGNRSEQYARNVYDYLKDRLPTGVVELHTRIPVPQPGIRLDSNFEKLERRVAAWIADESQRFARLKRRVEKMENPNAQLRAYSVGLGSPKLVGLDIEAIMKPDKPLWGIFDAIKPKAPPPAPKKPTEVVLMIFNDGSTRCTTPERATIAEWKKPRGPVENYDIPGWSVSGRYRFKEVAVKLRELGIKKLTLKRAAPWGRRARPWIRSRSGSRASSTSTRP